MRSLITETRINMDDNARDVQPGDLYPALRVRGQRTADPPDDSVRRELARAYERGALTAEELASTLERLEPRRAHTKDARH